MYGSLNSVLCQEILQSIAFRRSDNIQMKCMYGIRPDSWQSDFFDVVQKLRIPRCVCDALICPLQNVRAFREQHRCLNGIESAVNPFNVMLMLFQCAVVRVHAHLRCQFIVASDNCTCITICAKVLSGIETKGSSIAKCSNVLAIFLAEMRLCTIFNKKPIVFFAEGPEIAYVRGLSIQ